MERTLDEYPHEPSQVNKNRYSCGVMLFADRGNTINALNMVVIATL